MIRMLRTSGIWAEAKLTSADASAYRRETCDYCNAFKMRRKAKAKVRWATELPADPVWNPSRALRPVVRMLLDVFGPVRWPSAQHGYIYIIGWWCQATNVRFLQGTKAHTAPVVEEWNQRLLAALR